MSSKKWPTLKSDGYDKHVLYEAAVQGVDVDIDLFNRVFKKANGRKPLTIREDFCGTGLLASEWVKQGRKHHAWGVDLDGPTLKWAAQNRITHLEGNEAGRIHLLKDDVLSVRSPKVDVLAALNFSFQIFRDRDTMKLYFNRAFNALNPGGFFFTDVFGGPQAQSVMKETKNIPKGVDVAGHRYPAFVYTWDQAAFNAVDNELICHIHFKIKNGPTLTKAFTYPWRLWSLPELRDIMQECGFETPGAYFEGWDDDEDETDGCLRKRKRYEEMEAWVGYLAARKPE